MYNFQIYKQSNTTLLPIILALFFYLITTQSYFINLNKTLKYLSFNKFFIY